MPNFECRVARSDGTITREQIEGIDENMVRSQLEAKGYLVFSVRRPRDLSFVRWKHLLNRRLPATEFLIFNQEFLALIRAGLPIIRVLDILVGRAANPNFQTALTGVREGIKGGLSISDAFARYPIYFSGLYVSSVRAGERSGNLVEILQRHTVYLKRMLAVRKKVVSALAYPGFLLLIGVGVIFFMLTYVMPTFMEIFKDSQTELPVATRRLIFVAEFLQNYLGHIVIAVIGSAFLVARGYHMPWGRRFIDSFLLKIPVVSRVVERHFMITLSRTLSTTLAGGISLVPALGMAAEAMPNRIWVAKVLQTRERVQEGVSLAASLEQAQTFPKMSLEMIDVGENSGALVEMLGEVAEFHEDELDLYLGRLSTWVEPIMLLFIGVIVALIVISMYLPIFHLAGAIR